MKLAVLSLFFGSVTIAAASLKSVGRHQTAAALSPLQQYRVATKQEPFPELPMPVLMNAFQEMCSLNTQTLLEHTDVQLNASEMETVVAHACQDASHFRSSHPLVTGAMLEATPLIFKNYSSQPAGDYLGMIGKIEGIEPMALCEQSYDKLMAWYSNTSSMHRSDACLPDARALMS